MSMDTPYLQFSKSWKSPKEEQDIYIAKQDAYIAKLEKVVEAAREHVCDYREVGCPVCKALKELDGKEN